MKTKHESSNSSVTDGILSDQALRANEVTSHRDHSIKRVRTTCNKIKPGYNEVAKVDSGSVNQTGDVMMNNNIEVIQAQVASNEKVFNAGLAGHKAELVGHKAELDGHKSQVEGNFTATFAQMNADRKVAEAEHKAIQQRADADRKAATERADADRKAATERADADRKVVEAEHKAIQQRANADRKAASEHVDAVRRHLEDKIDASATSVKLWVIITTISVAAVGFAIVRTLGGL